jgi:hypothetical protein
VPTTSPTTRNDRVDELMEDLVAGVAELTSGEAWRRWLDVARRFHRYRTGVSGISEVNEWCAVSTRLGRG